jgi:hypothetical protein
MQDPSMKEYGCVCTFRSDTKESACDFWNRTIGLCTLPDLKKHLKDVTWCERCHKWNCCAFDPKDDSFSFYGRFKLCQHECEKCKSVNESLLDHLKNAFSFMGDGVDAIVEKMCPTPWQRNLPMNQRYKVCESSADCKEGNRCMRCTFYSCKDWLYECFPDLWSCVRPAVLCVLGVLVVGMTAFSMYEKFMGVSVKEKVNAASLFAPLVGQMVSSGDVRTANSSHRSIRSPLKVVSQGCVDDVVKRVYRNRVYLTYTAKDGGIFRGFGVGLRGRYIMAPRHYFQSDTETYGTLSIQCYGQGEIGGSVTLNSGDFSVSPVNTADLVIIEVLNRHIPEFKNITKSFIRSNMLSQIGKAGVLVEVSRSSINMQQLSHLRIDEVMERIEYQSQAGENGIPQYDLLGWYYDREAVGLCGSLLLDAHTSSIIGMHIAGGDGRGYAQAIVSDIFDGYEFKGSVDVDEPTLNTRVGKIAADGEFIPVGVLDRDQRVDIVTKTTILQSQCQGVLCPPVRVPVVVETKGEHYPGQEKFKIAIEKGFAPPKPFPIPIVDRACSSLQSRILSKATPVVTPHSVRTISQAVEGLSGVPFFDAMKLNTSPGWPLTNMRKGSKKRDWLKVEVIDNQPRLLGMRPEAYNLYAKQHEQRLQGIKPFDPYSNFLKDERLKPGKNPRLINGCSLGTTIEFRRYTMDFVAAIQSNNLDCGIGVGLNQHGMDWSRLTNRLLAMGASIGCGDYSGFGPGLNPELVLRCVEIINNWYQKHAADWKPEDDEVRRQIFEELAFSQEISIDTVIQTLCGSPSGNPMTVGVNSMVNLLYLLIMWQLIFEGTTLEDVSNFWLYVYVCVYGDDVIYAVSDSIKEVFNNEALNRNFAVYGIKYTDADKGDRIRKYCTISEATFLKCYFRKHDTRGNSVWLAALEKPMIEDMCNWIRKSPDPRLASLANCKEACRLAYAWGRDYHDLVSKTIQAYWCKRGEDFQIESWDYIDAMFFNEMKNLGENVVGDLFGFAEWSRKRDKFLSPQTEASSVVAPFCEFINMEGTSSQACWSANAELNTGTKSIGISEDNPSLASGLGGLPSNR